MVKQRFSNRNQRGRVSTATPQQEWATLGQMLQQLLRQQWLQSQSLLVRCAVREGTLLVLAEHLLHIEPDSEEIFTSLEAAIRALLPEILLADDVAALQLANEIPVQLLLRISGYQQPYASKMFYYIPNSSSSVNHSSPLENFPSPLQQDCAVQSLESAALLVEPSTPEPVEFEALIVAKSPQVPDPLEAIAAEIIEPEIIEPEIIEPEVNGIGVPLEEPPSPDIPNAMETVAEINASVSSPLISPLSPQTPEQTHFYSSLNEATLPALEQTTVEQTVEHIEPFELVESIESIESVGVDVVNDDAVVETDRDINPASILELNDQNQGDLIQTTILEDSPGNSLIDSNLVEQIDVEPIETIEPLEDETLQGKSTASKIEFENIAISTEENKEEIAEEILRSPLEAELVEAEKKSLTVNHLASSPAENSGIEQFANHLEHQQLESEPIEQLSEQFSQLQHEPNNELGRLPEPRWTEIAHPKNPDSSQQVKQVHQPEQPGADQNRLVNHLPPQSESKKQADEPEQLKTLEPDSRRPFRWSASNLGLASAVGGFVLVNGLYILTRPCVIGACEPLQQATQLSQTAIQTAQTTESALAVVEAYKQLNEASYLLATIPSWSRHHRAAQTLLTSYEDHTVILGKVVKALEQANSAAQKSQNPPHPLPEWREIQWLWREVIAQLEQIPPNSALYPLIQRKLQEYRGNLIGIEQRVGIEQQAQDRINAARQAGQLAEARAGAAQTAANWQETAATWATAIAQLRQIPQSTMVYDEAQQLLEIYQPNLAQATARQAQELIAAKAYTQALDAAAQARTSVQQNQWSQATARWQAALTYAQQVPSVTSYYSQAQPLISTYTQMLQQATQNSQRSTAIQSIKPNLNQACPNRAKICTYTLSPQAIRVQFTSTYDQTVSLTVNNKQPTDRSGSSTILEQVNRSLRILADASETTQVPVELYDAKGTKLGTYTPSLSGYVPQ